MKAEKTTQTVTTEVVTLTMSVEDARVLDAVMQLVDLFKLAELNRHKARVIDAHLKAAKTTSDRIDVKVCQALGEAGVAL